MADLVKGITHTAEVRPLLPAKLTPQGLAESTIALIHTALHVAYTFVHGLAMLLYNTVESFAAFLGASVNFVLCEWLIVGCCAQRADCSQPRTPGRAGGRIHCLLAEYGGGAEVEQRREEGGVEEEGVAKYGTVTRWVATP